MPFSEQQIRKRRTQTTPAPEPLVEVTRGTITESRHRGHIVAVDGSGQVVAFLGAPKTITYLRSSAKPHQALPLVVSGAADHFGFTEKEIALACASHSGEPVHTETALSILKKIGLEPSALKCGTHEPFSRQVTAELLAKHEEPNVLQNNCSGKHSGMLALALYLQAATETYDQPEHPVQRAIKRTIARFSGIPIDDIATGIDGCGVPVFGLPVRAMALMYARLLSPPADFDEPTQRASKRIVQAMLNYPEMVGGMTDRLDTEIIRAGRGRVISKVGAEGVYTAGVLPCEEWPLGLGLALKIEDGDDFRARPTVVIESLRQLGVLKGESLKAVSQYAFFPLLNRAGDRVGEVRASFELDRSSSDRKRTR